MASEVSFARMTRKLEWAGYLMRRQLAHSYVDILWLHWSVCEPPHHVTDYEHRDALIESLREAWSGPALIGYADLTGQTCQLLSGSHRWDASRVLDRLLPVRVYETHEIMAAWGDLPRWMTIMGSAPHIELTWEPPEEE